MPFLNIFHWYLFMLRHLLYLYVYSCCFLVYSYFLRYSRHITITLLLHTTINIKCFLHLLLLQTSVSFISLLDNRSRLSGYDSTGWAKSQFTYVGLNSSVTECSIEIILSGMTYYHHWFEEFVKSKHICVHFFQMKVHFRIYLIVWIVGSSQILLDCVWPFELRFY